MGATNGHKPASVVAVLQRADSRWVKEHGYDPFAPEYLEHLATFLQPVVQPDNAGPAVDEKDLALLREQAASAESNAAARRAERDQARGELDQVRAEIEQMRQALDAEHREAMRAVGALEATRRERDQLAEKLAAARDATNPEPAADAEQVSKQAKLIKQLREDYDYIAADNQKIADQLAAAQAQRDSVTDHRCSWAWHGPDEPVKPCTCGRSAPRYELREVG